MTLFQRFRLKIGSQFTVYSNLISADGRICPFSLPRDLSRFINQYAHPLPIFNLRRNFATFSCCYRVEKPSKHQLTTDHFAVSNPRLYKQLQMERSKDGMSPEWDLVFSVSTTKREKIQFAHWMVTLFLLSIPPLGLYAWWEMELEEDVIFAGFEMTKRTELMLFFLMQFLIAQMAFKFLLRLPRSIYYCHKSQTYTAILRSIVPWKHRRLVFKSTDIVDTKLKYFALNLLPWKKSEFWVKNKILILAPMSFRSGYDLDLMLRHVVPRG